MKKIAVIPARAGSKGLPDKNILPLCGKPLLAYTVEAAVATTSSWGTGFCLGRSVTVLATDLALKFTSLWISIPRNRVWCRKTVLFLLLRQILTISSLTTLTL